MKENVKTRGGLLLAAVIVTALNLRAPITGVGSLVDAMRADLGLSGAVTGILTTLPVLIFAIASLLAGRLAARFGIGRTLTGSMLLVAAGTAVRSWLGGTGLVLGMVIIGVGIACGNVLLPVVVKARWPGRIGPMTSLYTTAQSAFAGLAAGICVPLSLLPGMGWRGALAIWGVPALAAAALWGAQRDTLSAGAPALPDRKDGANVWRSRTAWYCTAYMGTQAAVFYSCAAWLPAILTAKGVGSAAAGLMASLYQLVGIASNFFAPSMAARMRDQRPLTGAVGAAYIAGALILWLCRTPGVLFAGVLLCGVCTGCAFSLCMALIGMRTRSAADASRLSVMLQAVGYAVAALGPVLLGRVLDATGSWNAPLVCLLVMVAVNSLAGQLAGKPGWVE